MKTGCALMKTLPMAANEDAPTALMIMQPKYEKRRGVPRLFSLGNAVAVFISEHRERLH